MAANPPTKDTERIARLLNYGRSAGLSEKESKQLISDYMCSPNGKGNDSVTDSDGDDWNSEIGDLNLSLEEEENGCFRCLNCLARVPCATLAAWVTMAMSTGACVGGLLIAREKTKDILDDDDFLQLMPTVCIGVVFGMIFIATLFLLVSVISSGRTSKQIFNTSKKNICGRVLNVFVVMMMVVLQVAWIGVTTVLSIPLLLIAILHYQHKIKDTTCFNLKHYGPLEKKFCGDDLRELYSKITDPFICFAIAYLAAVVVCLSMSYFMICAGSNVVFLRESRFVTYNAYGNDARASRDSMHVVDTKM